MREMFDVEIVFTDGTVKTVQSATHATANDGVLYLRRHGEYAMTDDLGAFPLVNVRSWQRVK